MAQKDIAAKYDCNVNTIGKALRKHGIARRHNGNLSKITPQGSCRQIRSQCHNGKRAVHKLGVVRQASGGK